MAFPAANLSSAALCRYKSRRMEQTLELTIRRLGAGGDGIADGPVFVAGALPGERVRAIAAGKDRTRAVEILAPSPDRVTPPCKWFGTCGGCSVQHLAEPAYAAWKVGLLTAALAARGLDVTPAPLLRVAHATRRRAEFGALRTPSGVAMGFHAEGSDALVDIDACLLLVPELAKLLPALRAFLGTYLRSDERADLHVTAADNGIDLLVTGRNPDTRKRAEFANFAAANGIVRVAWRRERGDTPEIVALHEAPRVTFAHVAVAFPPGAFLQASRAAELVLSAEVAASVGRAKRTVDLYAGLGTFTFPLTGRVHAVEGDKAAIAALESAARGAFRAGRTTAEARDLERRPLLPEELADYDAAIFDPPREGAAEQAAHLARSDVPVVVAVSCNPATFARDARTLVDGGYTLTRVVPVDQFVWTGHLELVAVFAKPRARRRR